jgi:uncharacterized protein YutD
VLITGQQKEPEGLQDYMVPFRVFVCIYYTFAHLKTREMQNGVPKMHFCKNMLLKTPAAAAQVSVFALVY